MGKPKKKPCGVCGNNTLFANLKKHHQRTHLPWYMSPANYCADCQIAEDHSTLQRCHSGHSRVEGEPRISAWVLLINGFLLFVSSCLAVGSLEALVNYVVVEQLFSANSQFSEEEQFFLREYDRLAGLEPKELYGTKPSRTSELLHHSTLACLLSRLSTEHQTFARSLTNYKNFDGSTPASLHPVFRIHVVDAHFHWDRLIGSTGHTFSQLHQGSGSEVVVAHAIANFVYPKMWGYIERFLETSFSFTLGIHPHKIFLYNYKALFGRLRSQFEKYPMAIAVGEIGLDFTTECQCSYFHNRAECRRSKMEAQHYFLEECLKLADHLSKPVVIHCCDNGDGSAAQGVLDMFVSLNLTHLKVQRHCFVGNSSELEAWSQTLPNCFFSLSRKSVQDEKTVEALLLSDHSRLLLETDSPYLRFQNEPHHGPWRVDKVARTLSNIIGVPVPEIHKLNNNNVKKLFGINW